MRATNIRSALERVFDLLHDDLKLDLYVYHRYDDGDGLLLEAHGGLSAREASAALHVPVGDMLRGPVAKDCVPVRLDQISRSSDLRTTSLKVMGIEGYCCIPLMHGGMLLGTLGFGRRSIDSFDDEEFDFLQNIAGYVALASHRLSIERALRAGVAERDRLLAQLREMEQKMIELTRVSALGAVAASIAQELNEPLCAATNYVSAIRMDPHRESLRTADRARSAEKELLRAGDIIRRIRRMVSREGLSLEAEDVEPLVNEAISLVKAASPTGGPRYSVIIGASAGRVVVDHIQIVQILANLLRNAVAATRGMEWPMVAIHTRRVNDDEVEFRVIDNGPGVPREVRAALFQPRLGISHSGLGLGLAIARNLVEAHGGTIQVEDAPAGGACFCFTVPALRED